jgi:predicted cation transporter
MSLSQITGIVLSLCISGGMLIPGNIPNIVAACRLKISMKEWAAVGVPIRLALMAVYFIALYILLRRFSPGPGPWDGSAGRWTRILNRSRD